MKCFIACCILCISLIAQNLDIKETYLIDKNNALNIENIIKNQNDFIPIKKYNLGIIKNTVWIKIDLLNKTQQKETIRVNNKIAGINLIDVFVIKNMQITQTAKLGNLREHHQRDNHFRTPYFDVDIEPLDKVTIFIKQKTSGTMDIRWDISTIEAFEDYYFIQGLVYAYFTGILSVMTLLAFTLFFLFKKKHFLIYALFTIFLGVFQLTVSGFFYQFGIPLYLNKIFGFFTPVFSMILFGLFPLYFFTFQKNECNVLKTIIKASIILLCVFIFILLFYLWSPDVFYYMKFYVLIAFFLMVTLLILSVKMYLLKKDGALFYLLANAVYFFFALFYIVVSFGIFKHIGFLYYSISVGAIGQDIFLAFGLIHSIYLLKKRNEKNTELLHEYSKLSFIGQTIINISHQWKAPINNIYNSINHIEVAREFKDKDLDNIIDINFQKIKKTTNYLKDTALNQLDFYKDKNQKEIINIYQEILSMIRLIENEFTKKSIDIEFHCDVQLTMHLEKNYFLNVLMVLFENSFKIFEKRAIKNPKIILNIIKKEHHIEVIFQDNAQGVSKELIEKIFDKDYSQSDSSGIGLYLAKEIVSYKLQGEIVSTNIKNGIQFTLNIPMTEAV